MYASTLKHMHRAALVMATCLTAVCTGLAAGSDYATSVVEYVQGAGVITDVLTGSPFNNPNAALGRPTVDTTGDGWFLAPGAIVPVNPVSPAFRSFELVSIGTGGHLTLQFDHPVTNDPSNTFGLDFIVFGNAKQLIGGGGGWLNGDPALTNVGSVGATEPGPVSVSQDGQTWYTFTDDLPGLPAGVSPFADDFAPTLGRRYNPNNPDTSIGPWNLWWSGATDPTSPIDPTRYFSHFSGWTVAEIASAYGPSAGGTGFDLDWLDVPGLDWIQYVRIESPADIGTTEVDAIADVAPVLVCDFNADRTVNLLDIVPFVWALTDVVGFQDHNLAVDLSRVEPSGDRIITLLDIPAFVGLLTGGGQVAPVPEPTAGALLCIGLALMSRRPRRSRVRRSRPTVDRRRQAAAFTLIELLVVIAIMAVLMGLLVPALGLARESTKSAACLSNLKQMATAAQAYANGHDQSYPLAYDHRDSTVSRDWDYTITIRGWSSGGREVTVQPGILWEGWEVGDVQQCPSFDDGPPDAPDEPYTGYNYNTSYIGHGSGEVVTQPAHVDEVAQPASTALFGDGEWGDETTGGGPNKFMRSPWAHAGDMFAERYAGTQGYRHGGRTNVAFCDGHAETWPDRYTQTYGRHQAMIGENTGFLSADNSMYDLE